MKNIKLFFLLLIIVLAVIASGCTGQTPSAPDDTSEQQTVEFNNEDLFAMELISSTYISHEQSRAVYFYVFRNTATDVLYLYNRVGDGGGVTVMLDPETGMPLTYTKYIEIYKGDPSVFTTGNKE